MSEVISLKFGQDKSQIVRAVAVIFMIILHNDTLPEFKICVPMFTFLVGYGYAFAKEKNIIHGLKRIWHLLCYFWLILLGIFLPTAILAGGYHPSISNVLENMFGLESNLNWYSWYVYFYIFAMLIMIPASRIIKKFGIPGVLGMLAISVMLCVIINHIPGWSDNMWLQAAYDCFLCSPAMYSGFYLAEGGGITKIRIRKTPLMALALLAVMAFIFFLRKISIMWVLDFVSVPIFVLSLVAFFNIIDNARMHNILVAVGKQSMNMWFIHALFATECTAGVFAQLLDWIHIKAIHIIAMILVSFFAGKMVTSVYEKLSK